MKKQPKKWYQKIWETPWMRYSALSLSTIMLTVLAYFGQQYSEWLGASLVSIPTCVQDDGAIGTFPVPNVIGSLSQSEILKAIEEKKISTIHGKPYSHTPSQLEQGLENLLGASTLQDLTALQQQEYHDGGHIGIDIPVWWAEESEKENMPIVTPFKQAEVYKIWKLAEGSNTWGNAVTLCFTNTKGTYFAHFAHMKDEPLVTTGQVVTQGTRLGTVGNTGLSYGAHLHFQVNKAARYNPYYSSKKTEIISTFIDPLVLTLKQNVAMGSTLVAGEVPSTPSTPTTTDEFLSASIMDISLSPSASTAKVGEKVTINIQAKDQSGTPTSGRILIASSTPLNLPTEQQINNGTSSLEVVGTQAGDVELTIKSEDGNTTEKITLAFEAEEEPVVEEPVVEENSENIFTDVTPSSVSSAEYNAIQYLKEKGITKGNPDGLYGINNNLNRAGAATFLIRAFYPQIDLDNVSIGAMPFSDVPAGEWYAAAMYVSSLEHYNDVEKPVIIKGSNGKANPAGDVKLEEFSAMVLRVLNVEVPQTDPWYQGYLDKMSQIGLVSQSESNTYLGKPIPRKMVARILHQAVIWNQSNPNGLPLSDEEKAATEPEVVEEEISPAVDAPTSPTVRKNSDNEIILEWVSSGTANVGYTVYRQLDDGVFEEVMNKLTSPIYLDTSTVVGRKHTYKVVAKNLNTGEASEQTDAVSLDL